MLGVFKRGSGVRPAVAAGKAGADLERVAQRRCSGVSHFDDEVFVVRFALRNNPRSRVHRALRPFLCSRLDRALLPPRARGAGGIVVQHEVHLVENAFEGADQRLAHPLRAVLERIPFLLWGRVCQFSGGCGGGRLAPLLDGLNPDTQRAPTLGNTISDTAVVQITKQFAGYLAHRHGDSRLSELAGQYRRGHRRIAFSAFPTLRQGRKAWALPKGTASEVSEFRKTQTGYVLRKTLARLRTGMIFSGLFSDAFYK